MGGEESTVSPVHGYLFIFLIWFSHIPCGRLRQLLFGACYTHISHCIVLYFCIAVLRLYVEQVSTRRWWTSTAMSSHYNSCTVSTLVGVLLWSARTTASRGTQRPHSASHGPPTRHSTTSLPCRCPGSRALDSPAQRRSHRTSSPIGEVRVQVRVSRLSIHNNNNNNNSASTMLHFSALIQL